MGASFRELWDFVYLWGCYIVEVSVFSSIKKLIFSIFFVEDGNSWGKATHEYNKNCSITNSNDSTVIVFIQKNLLSGAILS